MNHSTVYWTRTRKLVWLVIGSVICALWGLVLITRIGPPQDGRLNDFVQEWASARNYFAGEPVYKDLRESVAMHLGTEHAAAVPLDFNAHPPVAVLVALPFASLEFRTASVVWNVVSVIALAASLAMIFSRYGRGYSLWALLPVLAVLLPGSPLAHQFMLVQFNLVLLGLITAAWFADRNGRPRLSGALVAIAASIKLFPAFLFLYFFARRRWQAVWSGALTVVVLHGAALLLFGPRSFQMYVAEVIPTVSEQYRAGWQNASLAGFWSKLFDPSNSAITPLWAAPWLAQILTVVCAVAIAIVLGGRILRGTSLAQHDHAFMACVIGMVLLSPIVWHHYFLLLLLPLLVLWPTLSVNHVWRMCLIGLVVLLAVNPHWIMDPIVPGDGERVLTPGAVQSVATPLHVVTVLSYQFYTILALLLLTLLTWPKSQTVSEVAGCDLQVPATTRVRFARRRIRLAWFAVLQLMLISSAMIWGGYRLTAMNQRRALPELRNQPLSIEPRFNMPEVVSDEQLRHVLTKLLPRFRDAKAPVSTVDHALRMWGLPATFDDPTAMSGKEMRRMLIDHQRFIEIHGELAKPLLNEVGAGVRYRTQEGTGSSSHFDHTLACLSEVGTPLDFPVRTSRQMTTVRAIMEQALRDFSLNQFEYEWSALVFALHVKSPGTWITKDGQQINFDRIADRIMRQRLPQGVCRGQHRMHALVMLLRVDEHDSILSKAGRQRVLDYLTHISCVLTQTQHSDGYWEGKWHTGRADEKAEGEQLMDRLLVTGHVLEWWALAPREILPPRENIVRAGQWTVRALDRFDQKTIIRRYGPLSHAGRALALWRGKFPYQVPLGPSSASPNVSAAAAHNETSKPDDEKQPDPKEKPNV